MRLLTLFFLFLTFAHAQQRPSIICNISSRHLVEGEVAYFNLIYRGDNPRVAPPETIKLDKLILTQRGFESRNINGDRYYIYQYPIVNATTGSHTIPSLDLRFIGKPQKTTPVSFEVVSRDSLKKEQFKYKNRTISCFSKAFLSKTSLYPGESVELEYKIYVPANLNPLEWGQPKVENPFNCTAWRFNSPTNSRDTSSAFFDNQRYLVASYTTVLSSINAGDARFGPITTDIVISPSSINARFGFSRLETAELPITSSLIELEVLDFPSIPPAEFNGAIGTFSIEADLPAKKTLSLNEAITATVTIAGAGNLPDIQAPELEDTATWKVVDVSRVQQGEERKDLEGQTQFTYILQPQRGANALPRFTFAHFDPHTQKFNVDTTTTSPIIISEPKAGTTAAVLPAVDVPKEDMKDILGPLTEPKLAQTNPSLISSLPLWWWQVIPASVLLLFLLTALIRKVKVTSSSEDKNAQRLAEFKMLEASNDTDFLKEAGAFIERWHSGTEKTQTVINQRDAQCYQPEGGQSVSKKQRNEILRLLKSLALVALLSSLAFSSPSRADEVSYTAWENGDYQEALTGYLAASEKYPHSADLLFNIGDCYYRTNQLGKATLYFEKALALNPQHYEARKNLDFTRKHQGSILAPGLQGTSKWIAQFPAEFYQQIAIAGAWGLLLSIVALKLFALRSGKLAFALSVAIISPLIGGASLAAWITHPQRQLDTTGEAAVITQYSAVLTEPRSLTGKELEEKTIINATPTSPCRIIAVRKQWSYIELANGTRGWVPSDSISKI